jgi:Ca2+-binding EF-hand superfamily protein
LLLLLLLPLLQLLGLQVKRSEIGELLAEVDSDGSGEVEYPEFIEIMTSTLSKLAEKKEQEGSAGNQVGRVLLRA